MLWGFLAFCVVILIIVLGGWAIITIGLPLVALSSWIAGVDIASRMENNTLCSMLPPSALPLIIGPILYLVSIGGVYGGGITLLVGALCGAKRFTLLNAVKAIAVGLLAAILLGFLVRYLYSNGICY